MASANSNGRNVLGTMPTMRNMAAVTSLPSGRDQWVAIDLPLEGGVCVCERECVSVWARRKDMEEWIKLLRRRKKGWVEGLSLKGWWSGRDKGADRVIRKAAGWLYRKTGWNSWAKRVSR